jgi:hypothetical protein
MRWRPAILALCCVLSAAAGARADEPVDVVQLQGTRLYHLDATAGLLVYDVSAPEHPQRVGRHAVEGRPLGVAVRGGVATLVMRWSDAGTRDMAAPGPALVRSVDVRDPAHPRVLGDSPIEGDLRDARMAGDSLYVVSETRAAAGARVVLTSLRLDGSGAAAPHVLRREGAAGAVRVAGDAIILVHGEADGPGTRVEVLADDGRAQLTPRGSLRLDATIGHGDRETSARIDAPDAAHVRVLGCRTVLCVAGDPLEIATIDARDADRPRVVSTRVVPSPGAAFATRFDGARLLLAPRGWLTLGTPSTPASVVDLDTSSVPPATHQVDGVVRDLVVAGPQVLVLGTRSGSEGTHESVFASTFDVAHESAPLADALVAQGWATSAALESAKAVAWRDGLLAVPFGSWRPSPDAAANGVALFQYGGARWTRVADVPVHGVVERLVYVGSRLLAVTNEGAWPIDVTSPSLRRR